MKTENNFHNNGICQIKSFSFFSLLIRRFLLPSVFFFLFFASISENSLALTRMKIKQNAHIRSKTSLDDTIINLLKWQNKMRKRDKKTENKQINCKTNTDK